jgi:hypothetical protein
VKEQNQNFSLFLVFFDALEGAEKAQNLLVKTIAIDSLRFSRSILLKFVEPQQTLLYYSPPAEEATAEKKKKKSLTPRKK